MTPAQVFDRYKLNMQATKLGWLRWVEPMMCECVKNGRAKNGKT